jgi:hypothetical protein
MLYEPATRRRRALRCRRRGCRSCPARIARRAISRLSSYDACDWSAGHFEIARSAVLAILSSEPVRAVTWAFLATGIEPHAVNRTEVTTVEFGTIELGRDDCVRVVRPDRDARG